MELFKIFGTIAINNSDANNALDETTGKAQQSQLKIVEAFKKVGTAVVSYFAVDKIKEFGAACIGTAADAQAMESQFSQVFGDMEDEAGKSLTDIAKGAGISENRMKGSFTKIAAFAKTTGMETADALELADRAMIAVADSAAFYDRSLEDTTESLQSFLKGNFENDAALGLSCTEVTRNTAAMKLFGAEYKELSEAQKQLTLLQMVEDANALSGALGQASRESNTWTNQTGNLKQAWTDLQSTLGKPILNTAVTVAGDLATKIGELVEKFTEGENPVQMLIDKFVSLKEWLEDLGTYASETFMPLFEDLQTVFEAVGEVFQPLIDKIKEYFSSGQAAEDITNALKDAMDLLAGAYESIKGFIQAVIDKLPEYVTSGQAAEDITNGIKDAFGWLSDKLTAAKDALQPLIDKVKEYFTSGEAAEDVSNAISTAMTAMADAAQWVYDAVVDVSNWCKEHKELLETVAIIIGSIAAAWALVNGVIGIFNVMMTVTTAVSTAAGAAINFLTSPITLVIAAVAALIAIVVLCIKHWDKIKETAINVWNWIKAVWEKAANWFRNTVVAPITGFFSGLWEGIKSAAQGAWNFIKGIWEAVTGWFDEKIVKPISEMFTGLWEGLKEAFKAPINWIIEGINKFIRGINNIEIPDWVPAVGGKGFHIPELPLLAKGGVLEEGQVGLLEGSGAEAVVPLDQNRAWISAVAKEMNVALGGNNQQVQELKQSFDDFVRDLPEMLMDAFASMKFDVNNREFARMVKAVN